MKCRVCREQLSELAGGELAPRRAEVVEAHVAGCVDCRRAYDQLCATLALLRGLRDEPLPEGYTPSLHRALVAAPPPASPSALVRAREWLGLGQRSWATLVSVGALAVVVVLLVGERTSWRTRGTPAGAAVEAIASGPVVPVFRVPRTKLAVVRVDFVAEEAVEDVEFAIALPEGLHFVSQGQKLTEREFRWRGRLEQGSNAIPIAVRGERAGRYEVAARAVGENVDALQKVVLEVTPG